MSANSVPDATPRQLITPFFASAAVTFAAAASGAQFQPGDWYESLNKPPLNPPNWIFGPVWTVLYLMMALAAGWVWSQAGWRQAWPALAVYGVQLILNAAWSLLFFGCQAPAAALIDIGLLWVAIIVTIILFVRTSWVAGGLLLPYQLWVTFATYLNFMLWRLN